MVMCMLARIPLYWKRQDRSSGPKTIATSTSGRVLLGRCGSFRTDGTCASEMELPDLQCADKDLTAC